jgi:eukaryotic-like serine/threonine-protein kinase
LTAVSVRVPTPPVPDRVAAEGAARCFGERYEIVRELGRGGMGQVWLARDHVVGRDVALKVLEAVLSRSVEHRERFRREALIAARFPHPHVVQCYEWHCDRTAAVAVMRYVRGVTLADRLRGAPLPPRDVCGILAPIADALAHLHKHGVVHRDLKPENILLQSEDGRPFLTDFGIATLLTSEQSRAEVVRRYGTPDFMAPEQLVGDWDSDHRSDIYSLGLVGFNALAGRLPTPRGLVDAPPLRQVAPDVPAALGRIIDRCLARDPRRRWPNAAALRDALARAADGAGTLRRRLQAFFS